MSRTITVVLGGGRGTRLRPLTEQRAKPAVPVGGKYRLIDIPISNAINSGLRELFVLTQFNSASLNTHISKTYRFDPFGGGFVEVLAAEQTDASGDWYQGTADAVRQHLHRFLRPNVDHVLILSGDHLYRMDYARLIERHESAGADITVSTIGVDREGCEGFGVMAADARGILRAFKEKPASDEDISDLAVPDDLREQWQMGDARFLASMGVYVFRAETLRELLDAPHIDFGRDILPKAIHTHRVAAHLYRGYWEDIGTIKAFYEANLMLTDADTRFRFYTPQAPIFTRPRFMPPSFISGSASLDNALVADGCQIRGGQVRRSVIGLRSVLEPGCVVDNCIIMGADFYETPEILQHVEIPIGIGEGASIKRAIIDKNARIGAGCVIHGSPDRPDEEHATWCVRDGVVIVAKNATVPPGTVL